MDKAWPYLLVLIVLAGLLLLSMRNQRRKAAAQVAHAAELGPGSAVMTTSGLYGTVRTQNGDGTVQLQIADGIEVRWALAALRDADNLPEVYRRPLDGDTTRELDPKAGGDPA